MTKKDFEMIARALSDEKERTATAAGRATLKRLAYRMADELRQTNPRFDRDRFLAAASAD